MALADIQELSGNLIDTCKVVDLTLRTHQSALVLMAHYNFSMYDANIVAAAGLANCAVLYSEDMQDGLSINTPTAAGNATLSIRNPFREA